MEISQATINVKLKSSIEGQLRPTKDDLLLNLFRLWTELLIFQLWTLMLQFIINHELQVASTVGGI